MSGSEKPFDVFISHSKHNKLEADVVCGKLEAAGIRCWIAPRDIVPGTEWGEGILDGIDKSRAMVLVFSEHANSSPQVRREVERAINRELTLIPFRVQNVLPTRAMEYCLGNTHWLDAFDPPLEMHVERLISIVRQLIGDRAVQPAAPNVNEAQSPQLPGPASGGAAEPTVRAIPPARPVADRAAKPQSDVSSPATPAEAPAANFSVAAHRQQPGTGGMNDPRRVRPRAPKNAASWRKAVSWPPSRRVVRLLLLAWTMVLLALFAFSVFFPVVIGTKPDGSQRDAGDASGDVEHREFDTETGGSRALDSDPSNRAADRDGTASTPQAEGTTAGDVRDDNGLTMKMVWCPPGRFTMGSPKSEEGRGNDEDQVEVTLTKGYWLGKHEVTQAEWKEVMGTEPWTGETYAKAVANNAASCVSWEDAREFCGKLTGRERQAERLPAGWAFRLATEAEWEYACRAGTKTKYSFGDSEDQSGNHAWFEENAGALGEDFAHQVGQKRANPWGLHDMHGNVWEWCEDVKLDKLPGGTDPVTTTGGWTRVFRGGSWSDDDAVGRSGSRNSLPPGRRSVSLGFRAALGSGQKTDVNKPSPIPTVNPPTDRDRTALAPRGEGAAAGDVRDDNGLAMKLVWCPPGRFTMGSPKSEEGRGDDEDQVEVTLTKGYWLGKYEVTQAEWKQVMETEPWKGEKGASEGANYPACNLNWNDAREFCFNLTDRERQAGRLPASLAYRLPTEAEWEYACRAGTKTRYSSGDSVEALAAYAWFSKTPGDVRERFARPVGQKKPNAWGLHDMHGNVWESCEDVRLDKLPGGADPIATGSGPHRVERGGSRWYSEWFCRSAYRGGSLPGYGSIGSGFRVALSSVQ